VSSASDRIIARAYVRVQARHQAAGTEMDRQIRKAGKHLRAAAGLSSVIRRSPALRSVAAERKLADFDLAALMAGDRASPKAVNGHGPRAAGPPRWHPESRRETEDD
jgi:hypothetical protein